MDKVTEYINRIENAIAAAEAKKTKLTQQQFEVVGMASTKNRILLNEILTRTSKYLEIGCWHGSTFVAALYGNGVEGAVAIDNFSEFTNFTKTGGVPSVEKFMNTCNSNGLVNYVFINKDCFDLNETEKSFINNVNVYFYDGGHTEEDQTKALTYYKDMLADEFILIVDDWNELTAQIGTKLGLQQSNIEVVKDWNLYTEMNADPNSWWNGVYIAVCRKIK